MQYEAELSDGRIVTVESDHEPTEKEILGALGGTEEKGPAEAPGALSTGLRSGALGVAPGAAAAAAFGPSAAVGAPFAPETFGIAPLVTGVIGAGGAALLAEAGQSALLKKLFPKFMEETERGAAEHPVAAGIGRVASALPSFEFAPGQTVRGIADIAKGQLATKPVKALAAQLGTQTGILTAQTGIMEHRLPTPAELLEAAATAATFGHPRFGLPVPKGLTEYAKQRQDAYASKKQEAAAIHGDVRTQQEPAQDVPAQGGGPGVQPRPETMAQGPQIPLTPTGQPAPVHSQDDIPHFSGSDSAGWNLHFKGVVERGFPTRDEAEKAAMQIMEGIRPVAGQENDFIAQMEEEAKAEGKRQGVDFETHETNPTPPEEGDETVPFAGAFFEAKGEGKANLYRDEFRGWVEQDLMGRGLNEDQIKLAIHSRVAEEKFHNDVMSVATDQDLAQYSRDLTAAEKAIERRIYGKAQLNDVRLAHEAIRRRLQQAHGMTPSEFAETIGKEHVTIKTLDYLGRIIRKSREALGTKAAGRQALLYKRALGNIDYAKAVLSGRQNPMAARRETQPWEDPRDEEFELEQEMQQRGVLVDGKYYKVMPDKEAEAHRRDIIESGPDAVTSEAASGILFHGYREALQIAEDRLDDFPSKFNRALLEETKRLKDAEVRIGPVLPPPEWKSEVQQRFPFASRRGKKGDEGQSEMFSGVPLSAPKLIKATDPEARKIPEGMTLPAYNANQIEQAAQKVFESAKGFRVFHQWMQRNVGKVPTGPAFNIWIDTVTKNLRSAPGEAIKKMVEALGVQHRVYPFTKRVGTKELEHTSTPFTKEQLKGAPKLEGVQYIPVDIPDHRDIPPDPRELPASIIAEIRQQVADKYRKENLIPDERLLAKEQDEAVDQARHDILSTLPFERRRELIEEREGVIRGQKTRAKAISAIFQKLIEEGAPSTEELGRKEIALDDLDWSNPNAQEGVWRDIRGDEAQSIDKLNAIFKDEARRSSFDNVSHTKRVAVLLNKQTGEVTIVSAYPHGRSGTMVFDPSGATGIKGKPNVTLASTLPRWRPIASMLLKEPIKDFYKKFKDIGEFNEYIGKDAQETERSFTYDFVGEGQPTHWRDVPEWLQGDYEHGMQGGYWQDSEEFLADAYKAAMREQDVLTKEGETTFRFGTQVEEPGAGIEYERKGGQLLKDRPFTAREALAVRDYVSNETIGDRVRSKEEMASILSELALKAEQGKLKAKDWVVITALRKAANETWVRENKGIRELRKELRAQKLPDDIPYISHKQAYEIALDRFYDYIQGTESQGDYLAEAMGEFSRPARSGEQATRFTNVPRPEAAGQTGPAFLEASGKVTGGGVETPRLQSQRPVERELEIPLTRAEELGLAQKRRHYWETQWQGPPLPSDVRTEPSAPELLSPEAMKAAEERAKLMFEYEPTSPERKGFELPKSEGGKVMKYVTRPEFIMRRQSAKGGFELGPERRRVLPAAARRARDYIKQSWEELGERAVKYTAPLTRATTIHDINASRDGADRRTELYSNGGANEIRIASVKPSDKPRKPTITERLLGGVFYNKEARTVREAAKAVIAAKQEALNEAWREVVKEWTALHAEYKPLIEEAKRRHKTRPEIPEERKPKAPKIEDLVLDERHFEKLLLQVDKGIRQAEDWSKAVFPGKRIAGRRWLRAAQKLRAEVEYAQKHFNDPEMKETVDTAEQVLDQHLNNMNKSGISMNGRDFYVPGLYQGEYWNDHAITFGDLRILGRNYRMPKTFANYYEAISNGPYIPVNGDIADLAQHALAAGARVMNNDAWLNDLKHMTDPQSKQPIAIEPQLTRTTMPKVDPDAANIMDPELEAIRTSLQDEVARHDPDTKEGKDARQRLESYKKAIRQGTQWKWEVPKGKLDYDLVSATKNSKPIAVRHGYKKIVEAAMAQSVIPDVPVLGQALLASQMLKHGLILIFDTFHPGRLAQYGTALAGKNPWSIKKPGFHAGLHAIMYSPESLPDAVKIGAVSAKDAKWATDEIKIYDRGRIIRTTRQKVLRDILLPQGLNSTQTADTLYRNSIQKLPFVGEKWNELLSPINKWIFDRITPGMIAQSAVENLERINPKNRHLSLKDQAREVVRDMNIFYGNMGRNGIFKNPNARDLAQIVLLAPLWQQGLLAKELRTLSRVTGISYAMGRKGLGADVYLGPLVRGVVRGLAAYFVLSQIANLASRRKFTWENEEPEHKLDAWLPIGGEGVWLSPMSVFGEVTHDLIRLGQSKPKIWDGITQFGNNKLGPIGRLGIVLHEGKTPSGEEITTTGGVLKRAAAELAPAPISLGTFGRAAAHAVAPQLVSPPRPGQLGQRALSSVGIKTQLPTRPETDIRRMADNFVKRENLKFEPMEFTPTDQASYAKLRGALRNDDLSGAAQVLKELRQHRTDAQIAKAMRDASTRPFTGTRSNEQLFLYSLGDKELQLYYDANMERSELYQKFLEWFTLQ